MKTAPDRCAKCAERMGRREGDSRGAMNTRHHSELGCLQDAASSGHHAGEESPRLHSRRLHNPERNPDLEPVGRAQDATAPMEVKKHQHKHNLKHRYEVMETLGKGTYGKVKKAVERASRRTVSDGDHDAKYEFKPSTAVCLMDAFLLYILKYLTCRMK